MSHDTYKFTTDDGFSSLVADSSSYADMFRKMGWVTNGTSYRHSKKRIARLGLDTSHFSKAGNRSPRKVKSQKEKLLLGKKDYSVSSVQLRNGLLEIGRPYMCEWSGCGNTGEWMGQKLSLEVDHVNGKRYDNRPENLRFLCRNCHGLTSTFGSRNRNLLPRERCACGAAKSKKSLECQNCYTKSDRNKRSGPTKIVWPDDNDLVAMLRESNFFQVGKVLGVSDNAVRKHMKKHGIVFDKL